MGFLRFILWTSFCIGLGIFLARYEVMGRAPLDHLLHDGKLDRLASGVRGAVDEAQAARVAGPTERHRPEEKAAVNKLIAKGEKR